MDTIGERIKKVIVYHGTTMTDFAKELNISQSMVSKICSGKANPSDRTVSDICRIYNINESWILHGEGAMTNAHSLENELSEVFAKVLPEDPEAQKRLVSAFAKIPPAAWVHILEHIRELAEEYKTNPEKETRTYEEGYQAGLRAAKLAYKVASSLNSDPQE